MGLISALFAFGLILIVDTVILACGFGRSPASLEAGGSRVKAAAFVIVLLFGVIMAVILFINPSLP